MINLKTKLSIAASIIFIFTMGSAAADPMSGDYQAKDAETHCSGSAGHGLWVNRLKSDCEKYFSLDADGASVVVSLDTGTGGTIKGTAVNIDGIVAYIDLTFNGYMDTIAPADYKQEGGLPYDGTTQDFYNNLFGTITIENVVYNIAIKAYNLQIGIGANAKNANLGLSTWISATPEGGSTLPYHWDLNFNLHKVPEPGMLALLGLGLFGAGLARRRKV